MVVGVIVVVGGGGGVLDGVEEVGVLFVLLLSLLLNVVLSLSFTSGIRRKMRRFRLVGVIAEVGVVSEDGVVVVEVVVGDGGV